MDLMNHIQQIFVLDGKLLINGGMDTAIILAVPQMRWFLLWMCRIHSIRRQIRSRLGRRDLYLRGFDKFLKRPLNK